MTAVAASWLEAAEALRPRAEAFIDGAFVPAASGATFADTSPRDGRRLADVARGGPEDVDRAVASGRAAFEAGDWSLAAPRERRRVLLRLADLMEERLEELALLECVDVGKPIGDALRVDVPNATACLRWYAEAVDELYGEIAPTGRDALALVEREPLGVIGAVVPWNYPLIITAWKLAPALATGNSVVLKPAEQSPLSALALAELASEAGLPDGVLNVVPGFGPEAGERDRLGIFYNAGQTCHAGSRLIAERSVREELVERVVAAAAELEPADPLDPAAKVGALIGEEPLERVLGHIERAREEGAFVAYGGERAHPVSGGSYLSPTVLDGVAPAASLVPEEVFGPVLAVQEAADAEEAYASPTRPSTAWRPRSGHATSPPRGGSPGGCAPARSGSTPTTPATSRPRSAA